MRFVRGVALTPFVVLLVCVTASAADCRSECHPSTRELSYCTIADGASLRAWGNPMETASFCEGAKAVESQQPTLAPPRPAADLPFHSGNSLVLEIRIEAELTGSRP